jgi:hypothetical protein
MRYVGWGSMVDSWMSEKLTSTNFFLANCCKQCFNMEHIPIFSKDYHAWLNFL